MTPDEQQIWSLLRELDDPDHMEFPRNYDHAATRARFDKLATFLGRQFNCTCRVDRGVQDASHHGTITIPAAATASGEALIITVSNFGNLVAPTLGGPGHYDDEETRILLDPIDRRRTEDALESLGYIAISEHLLWTTYDGVSNLAGYYSSQYPPTWWDRFFDYL